MMKMATGDGFPLRQGAGTGSRLGFRGYRGLRRRNFRSRVLSGGFYIYKNFSRRKQVKEVPEGPTSHRGAPIGLVATSSTSWPSSCAPGVPFAP